MWQARVWWWSRALEAAVMVATIIANRIPFATPVKEQEYKQLLQNLPLYIAWEGDDQT